uniref:Uncharacterized protein n=1 Tax=Chromera velia CCMP2878 TaxID=1169474 RepID=A0A0G4I0G0_9ALVE|eukprot:Cvel_9940.t1-p1 / transcript=Cvel_9940.t1 / gene=Cvel_9940 / organism=Chromera_velia_CCMP2878 / gene_product=hypothetical protein / transcript_product=hypothetical protein / location=Cvel_scaffold588:35972-38292(-) / protein_length=667 / sequence_SO=supercontig / SO=protein_coding / is_pseudo=false
MPPRRRPGGEETEASPPSLTESRAVVSKRDAQSPFGVRVKLSGQKERSLEGHSFRLDLHGDIFKALSYGTVLALDAILPLRLGRVDGRYRATETNFDLEFVIGYKSLSIETVKTALGTARHHGDSLFVVELQTQPINYSPDQRHPKWTTVMQVYTRPSKIIEALEHEGGADISVTPPPGFTVKYRQSSFYLLRWLFFPFLYLLFLGGILFAPSRIPTHLFPPLWSHEGERSVRQMIPPHPKTRLEAFALGRMAELLSALHSAGGAGSDEEAELLTRAGSVLGDVHRALTGEELLGMGGAIEELEARKGFITRIQGLFTFVNLLWLVGVVGISVSVLPSVYLMLKPLQEFLRRAARFLWQNFILPVIERLHGWGVLEAFVYWWSLSLVHEGCSSGSDEVAYYVALTGLFLLPACFSYSTAMHGKKVSRQADPKALAQVSASIFGFAFGLGAVRFESEFLGFLTVMCVYTVLGFSVVCFGLCWCIGFDSEASMARCVGASGLLLGAFVGGFAFVNVAEEAGMEGVLVQSAAVRESLRPFQSAMGVMGAVVGFLALLIISSLYFSWSSHRGADHEGGRGKSGYVGRNAVMVLSLFLALFFGNVLGLEGLRNSALVFGVLWIVEKYCELHTKLKLNGWFLILSLSLVLWRGALWLHQHPDVLRSIGRFSFN